MINFKTIDVEFFGIEIDGLPLRTYPRIYQAKITSADRVILYNTQTENELYNSLRFNEFSVNGVVSTDANAAQILLNNLVFNDGTGGVDFQPQIDSLQSQIDLIENTTFTGVGDGLPNYFVTVNPPFSAIQTQVKENYIFNISFEQTSDGQPLTLNVGFGDFEIKTKSNNNQFSDVLANQIIIGKTYQFAFKDNKFILQDKTENLVSISEVIDGIPNAVTSYSIFDKVPFDGQIIEARFNTVSLGDDTLDLGFGQFPICYANQSTNDTPILPGMIGKQTRHLLVWNSNKICWNLLNYLELSDLDKPISALTQQQLDLLEQKINNINGIIGSSTPDADNIVDTVSELLQVFVNFPEVANMTTLLNAKQDKTSVATVGLFNGNATTSQKLRLVDQSLVSELDVDALFSVTPIKNAQGKIILSKTNVIVLGSFSVGDFNAPVLNTGAINVSSVTIVSGNGTGNAIYQVNLATPIANFNAITTYHVNVDIESNTAEAATARATTLNATRTKLANSFQIVLRESFAATQNIKVRFQIIL